MIVALCLLFTGQAPAPAPPATPAATPAATTAAAQTPASTWVDGPQAPESTAVLPPATAPRDGEPGRKPPLEVLVPPPVPSEDARAAVDDGLLPALPDRRFATVFERRDLVRQAPLDLDSFFDRAFIPGLVWLPQQAGVAHPTSRGHGAVDIAVVVDDVPLLGLKGGGGGGAAGVTESIGLLSPARLTFRHGPRADVAGGGGLGGVLAIDTGGALDELGETQRVDGVLGAGYGGPDNEKGAFALVRSGWRTLRVTGHTTLLHREDFRTGRIGLLEVGADRSSVTLANTGGVGGTIGARVDVVPVDASRLFVSWQAGRGLDVGDVLRCPFVDADGRAVDCTRTAERGTDVVIVGFDLRRSFFGLALQPELRVHAQRALEARQRSGSSLAEVQTNRDEVMRGGLRLALQGRAGFVDVLDHFAPSFVVAVDAFADRYTSTFGARSLRLRDAEPAGDGVEDPRRATFVDGAVARQGLLSATLRADGDVVDLWAVGRLGGQGVDVDDLLGRAPDSADGAHVAEFLPGGEAGARLHLLRNLDVTATVGHLQASRAVADVLTVVRPTDVVVVGSAHRSPASDTFVEGGVAFVSDAVDVDAVVWGSLRSLPSLRAGGVEGRLSLKPVNGLGADLIASGYAANIDDAVAAAVLQPQAGVVVRYAPPGWPVGFFARVIGAVPQARLADDELVDPALCPELPLEPTVPQGSPCSGAPGFVTADAGAFLQLGQLRFDVVGENVTDAQGAWRGAALGTGGTAVRTRIAFLF